MGADVNVMTMDVDVKVMTDTYNTAMTTDGNYIIELHLQNKTYWFTEEDLNLFDTRRDLQYSKGAME